jgi:hypothetical protein
MVEYRPPQVMQATQYDYLDVAKGFLALKSKYLWFFSLRSGSRYVVGDITSQILRHGGVCVTHGCTLPKVINLISLAS